MPQTISFKFHRETIARLRRDFRSKLAKEVESAKIETERKMKSKNRFKRWLDEVWLAVERFLENKRYN